MSSDTMYSPTPSSRTPAQFSADNLFLPMAVDRDDGPWTPAVQKGKFQVGKMVVRLYPRAANAWWYREQHWPHRGRATARAPSVQCWRFGSLGILLSFHLLGGCLCCMELSAAPVSTHTQPLEEPVSVWQHRLWSHFRHPNKLLIWYKSASCQ